MRKLASIQEVSQVFPHPNADLLELVKINGWICVVRKDDFKVGDLGVYYEIDAFLPAHDKRYEFLSRTFRTFEGRVGARIKSIKIRKELSQGMILPITSFPEIANPEVGMDVTELLGVIKWEKPLLNSTDVKGDFPYYIKKTDQERIQNLPNLDRSGLWEKTEKMEGSSQTNYFVHGEYALESSKDHILNIEPSEVHLGVCSRNSELRKSDSPMWSMVTKYNLKERLEKLGRNLALQGEIIGPKIQDNIYKLTSYRFILFNIYDIDNKRNLLPYERMAVLRELNEMDGLPIEISPIVEYVELPQTDDWMEILLKDADGKSSLNPETLREGFVYKHTEKDLSFKVVSNAYLLAYDQ